MKEIIKFWNFLSRKRSYSSTTRKWYNGTHYIKKCYNSRKSNWIIQKIL